MKMSIEQLKLEKDLCRCCHSEGSFTNLYDQTTQDIMYSELLKNCLDISLQPIEGPLCSETYTICEACIDKLMDAFNFKKQVVVCEQRFQDLYSKNAIRGFEVEYDINVKTEPPDADLNDALSPVQDNEDYKFAEENVIKKSKGKTKAKVKKKNARGEGGEGRQRKDKEKSTPPDTDNKTGKITSRFFLRAEDYRRDGSVLRCARCDKAYNTQFSLRIHVKAQHYRIPKYKCLDCTREFMTLAPFTAHKLQAHGVDERFKCNACSNAFNTKVQLRKHINSFHMLGERIRCDACDYETFSFEGMYKHKFKHKTVKEHHCRFCRKAFLRKTTLDLHERIHTGDRRQVCRVCGQAFVQKASLNYHMAKHHPEVNY